MYNRRNRDLFTEEASQKTLFIPLSPQKEHNSSYEYARENIMEALGGRPCY